MPRPLHSARTDAHRTHDRLLRAAREVLAERGLQAEITEVVARAGFGAGTVYRNTPSKEALRRRSAFDPGRTGPRVSLPHPFGDDSPLLGPQARS